MIFLGFGLRLSAAWNWLKKLLSPLLVRVIVPSVPEELLPSPGNPLQEEEEQFISLKGLKTRVLLMCIILHGNVLGSNTEYA